MREQHRHECGKGRVDEGTAAVVAAIVGVVAALLGSAVGGLAAVRGAREGAKIAAREQHDLWLRQERRTAYGAIVQAVQRCETELSAIVDHTPDGQVVSAEDADRYRATCVEFVNVTAAQTLLFNLDWVRRANEFRESATHAAAMLDEGMDGGPELRELLTAVRRRGNFLVTLLVGDVQGILFGWSQPGGGDGY